MPSSELIGWLKRLSLPSATSLEVKMLHEDDDVCTHGRAWARHKALEALPVTMRAALPAQVTVYQAGVVNQSVTFNPWGVGNFNAGYNQFVVPGQGPSPVFLTSTAYVSPPTILLIAYFTMTLSMLFTEPV